jgi:glycine hydroxymethyltransferase
MLVDLTNRSISGRKTSMALNRCGIELNANAIPFDPRKPFDPSGIRIGLASLTSMGLLPEHMERAAALIDAGVSEAAAREGEISDAFADDLRAQVREFLEPFTPPGLPG